MRGPWGKTTATFSTCYSSAIFPISSMYPLYFTLLGRIPWLQRCPAFETDLNPSPRMGLFLLQSNKSLLEGSLPLHFIC